MARSSFLGVMIWGQVWRMGEVALSLLYVVLVVRSLDNITYGVYSTVTTFVLVAMYFLSMGIGEGLGRFVPVVRPKDPTAPFRLFRLFLTIRAVACVVVGLLVWLLHDWLAVVFNQPFFEKDSLLLAAMIVCYSLSELAGQFFTSMLWLKNFVVIRLVGQLFILVFAAAWFIFFGPSLEFLLAISALGNLLMLLLSLFGQARPGLLATFAKLQPESEGENSQERLKLPLKDIFLYSRDLWVIYIATVGLLGQMDVFLMALLNTAVESIGFYNLANLLVARLLILLQAWSTSLTPIISTVYQEKGKEGLDRYFTYYYRLSLPIQLIPMGGMALLAGPFIGLIFGERYLPAVLLLAVIAWFQISFALFGNTIATSFLNTLGRQRTALVWRCSCALLNLALDLIFIPIWGPLGAAFGTGISMALLHLLEAILVRELFMNIEWTYVLKILLAVVSGAILGSFIGGPLLLSFVGRGIFYAVWLLLFFWLTKPLTSQDLQLLPTRRARLTRLLRPFAR